MRATFVQDKTTKRAIRYTNPRHAPVEGAIYLKPALAAELGPRIVVEVRPAEDCEPV